MGKQWKQCQTLFFWAPKSLQMVIAAMKLKCLLLGRKVMTNLDSILKSKDITLPTKVRLVKAVVFPVVMYRCESVGLQQLRSHFDPTLLYHHLHAGLAPGARSARCPAVPSPYHLLPRVPGAAWFYLLVIS